MNDFHIQMTSEHFYYWNRIMKLLLLCWFLQYSRLDFWTLGRQLSSDFVNKLIKPKVAVFSCQWAIHTVQLFLCSCYFFLTWYAKCTVDLSFSKQCFVILEGRIISGIQLNRSTMKKCGFYYTDIFLRTWQETQNSTPEHDNSWD